MLKIIFQIFSIYILNLIFDIFEFSINKCNHIYKNVYMYVAGIYFANVTGNKFLAIFFRAIGLSGGVDLVSTHFVLTIRYTGVYQLIYRLG